MPEIVGQSIYPALPYAAPSPAPLAPGDAFSPAMGGTADASTPAGAEWTRTAGPDETVLLTGSRLSKYTDDSRGKDTRFVLYDGTAALKEASIQRVDSGKAIITLPTSTAKWGMYLVWPGNENGYGQPLAINKTDAWWVGPEKVKRGATISVYGRNLAHNNDTLSSHVYIKPSGGTGQWATVTRVNPYKVDFVVPANLANGDYEVWTHNGHGQQYGWSGPLKLTVYNGGQWNGPVLNVRTYGATGNGATDDTNAIIKALTAARQQTGATVYFPAGTYNVSNTLDMASNTRWKGDGPASVLRCTAAFPSSAETMVRGQVENVELRDLTLAGDHHYRGIHAEPVYLHGSKEVWITNIHFSFQGSNVLQLDEAYGVYISMCEFIGKTSFLGTGSQLFIDRCLFKETNDAEMALDSWGGSFISLTNSTCQDFDNSNPADSTGWGKGRFYAGRGNFGSAHCTYVGNSRTIDLAVRPIQADPNSGEQFMWEGYFTDWAGRVASSTTTTTTLAGFGTSYPRPHYAIITKGTGMGQSRRVTDYNGSTITLESAWNVPPDNTSVLSLSNTNDRAVMYHNDLDGKAYSVTTLAHDASTGIEPFGATTNFIASHNKVHDMRIGMTCWSTQQHNDNPDPNFFSFFADNTATNCRWGILNGLYTNDPRNSNLFGTTYRSNNISGIVQSAIVNVLMPTTYRQVINYFAYEHNTLQAATKGYSTGGDAGLPNGFTNAGEGIANQFFYKNRFSSVTPTSNFGIKATTETLVRENSLVGFAQPYATTSPQGELEAPTHVLELNGPAGATALADTLTLWNSGMSMLSWKATSNAAWLTLPVSSGTIPSEQASSKLALQASATGLTPGSYRATITVVANGNVKKYTVVLNLTASLSVNITSPKASGQFASNATILCAADVVLPTSTTIVSKVAFFLDGQKVGEATSTPYQYQWTTPTAGPHQLVAQATTADGLTASSPQVAFTVNSPLAALATQAAPTVDIFPVPTLGKLTITPSVKGSVAYKIFSNTAAALLSGTFTSATVLDVSLLPAGMYYLELILNQEQRIIRKFTKVD